MPGASDRFISLTADELVMVRAAVAAGPVENDAGLPARPLVEFGMVLNCRQCDSREDLRIASTMAEAGKLVAVIEENAARQGLYSSLTAAIDQGRAWVTGRPC